VKRLAHRDLQTLLSALSALHADFNAQTLPQRTLETIDKIIPGQAIFFDAFDTESTYIFNSWTNREDLYTAEGMEIFNRFAHQHPLIPDIIGGKIQSAIKITDYLSQSEYERIDLFNEYYRLGGFNRQMGLALPIASDFTFSCTVHRWGEDYTERDRLILTLLAPHLGNCINNSLAFERLNSTTDVRSVGVIAVDLNGKTQFVNEFARELLERYFAGEKTTDNSLPENLWNWIKLQDSANKKEFELPPPPFKVKKAGGVLTVRLASNNAIQEKTLLLEEKKFLSPKTLEQLNVTRREAEILFWIAQGKTDIEIGLLPFISPRTVHKHAENIYAKLGVETRTAAMLKALDVLPTWKY
jgi:DNA-binding CsgD family transcriptional regulator